MNIPLENKYRRFCELKEEEEILKKEIFIGRLRAHVENEETKEALNFFDEVKDELYTALCCSIKKYGTDIICLTTNELMTIIRKYNPVIDEYNFFKIIGLNVGRKICGIAMKIEDPVIEKLFLN